MLITNLIRSVNGSELKFSAQVDGRELWFKFRATTQECPPEFLARESPPAAPFLVAVLLLAMQKDEDIWIDHPISPQLLRGLEQYQARFHTWFPERFRVVQIHAKTPSLATDACAPLDRGHACAFSGGVDSFYTFLQLRSPTSEVGPLTDALFMAGFDMPLNLTASIQQLADAFTELMRDSGIRLWVGATNVRKFVNAVDWTNAHGQALAASALFFEPLWQTFTIPSSYLRESHPRWGTHPELDPLLSTENLRLSHHGADLHRVDKLRRIVQFRDAESRLRVCWIQDIGLRNCGVCEKCLRTMTALDLLGALPRYTTFNRRRVPLLKLAKLSQRSEQSRIFSRELIDEAVKHKRWAIAGALLISLGIRSWRRRGRRTRPS